ncbi:MAG: FAD-binding oxidoreductase [Bacteroidetes Order II. Incertae sedis bacterium]|nr:FAD-binding oxidoreductase [Bacteroidetes Order II. bacterium]
MLDTIVVGAGLVGSAAAKYLAKAGAKVLVLGAVKGSDDHVHSSHYDEARVTRRMDPDPVWGLLGLKAIEAYANIEHQSGIPFHTPCGHLRIDLPSASSESLHAQVFESANDHSFKPEILTEHDATARFPYLRASTLSSYLLEGPPAGIIHPQKLIRAQLQLACSSGARTEPTVGTQIKKENGVFSVRTSSGQTHLADNVLVSTGAYTNLFDLTPRKLDLSIRPETVLLIAIPETLLHKFDSMPGIIWHFDDHPIYTNAYVLPPVLYPDGVYYIKIGADHDRDIHATDVEGYHEYMTSPGSMVTKRALHDLILKLIPDLRGLNTTSRPCLLTYTQSGKPIIDQLDAGHFVAVGGCGKSAKSSDQIGKLAANMVLSNPWEKGFTQSMFAAS